MLLLWGFFFIIFFGIYFGSSSASWSAERSRTRLVRVLEAFVFRLILWNEFLFGLMREGILRARLTHWIIKIIYEIKNKYYEGISIHHFALLYIVLKSSWVYPKPYSRFFRIIRLPNVSICIMNLSYAFLWVMHLFSVKINPYFQLLACISL